jgi:Family of unknown function (DUF5763)
MRMLKFIFTFLILSSRICCNAQIENGEHCANVHYHNRKTGKDSFYKLIVETADNKLIKIKWPNGGWLDNSHFVNPSFDYAGVTSFPTFEGTDFEITITGNATECFKNSPKLVQCSGTTKKGNRCRNMTGNSNGYCWQHQ